MKKVMNIGNDVWDVYYVRREKNLVCVTVSLRRPNKKWYQSKYIYEKWDFARDLNEVRQIVTELTNKYYKRKQEEEELDEFFKNPIDK